METINENQSFAHKNKNLIGSIVAILTVAITLITFGIAYFTPPLSGPYCVGRCFQYPFLDIVSRFPRDYLWMYFAMFQLLVYVALMACIHRYAAAKKKGYSLIGFGFALISATILLIDYFLQVSVIQPSLLSGETDGLAILSQYNPHGIFIALEELGYLMMGIAFLCMAPVFSGSRIKGAVRWIFILSFILTFSAFLSYSFVYGVNREYLFEVAAISVNWLTLILAGGLLSFVFQRGNTE